MFARCRTIWAFLPASLVAAGALPASSTTGYSIDADNDNVATGQVRSAFRNADTNHDGYVSLAEFAAQNAGARAFTDADANKDGRLDLHEFMKAHSIDQRIKNGTYFDDAWITARIKADLLKDSLLDSLRIGVETEDGVVQISGEVKTSEQASHAIGIASTEGGVRSVRNSLVIK